MTTHTHTYTCTVCNAYMHTYTCTVCNAYMHIYIYIYIYIHTFIYTYKYIYIWLIPESSIYLGQMILLEESSHILYIGSPRISSLVELQVIHNATVFITQQYLRDVQLRNGIHNCVILRAWEYCYVLERCHQGYVLIPTRECP